ncbi:PaaI family thioesterase [Sphingobium aromaticiconvertens]|uniref:PaaI family thioesterase n=1 Tax=Sphingobium aromaticiconvertens TaxID=365341 RepID=UPI0030191951
MHDGAMIGPPSGMEWTHLLTAGEFIDASGPIYMTRDGLDADEPIRFGMRIGRHHCNGLDVCHGGMLATFLDTAMANGLLETGGIARNLPTINMALDYLAPAQLGDWVESRVAVLRRTRKLGFVQAILRTDRGIVIRGNAVFRIRPLVVEGPSSIVMEPPSARSPAPP